MLGVYMERLKDITDYDIQALIDNELDWESEKLVRQHIAADHHAAKRYRVLKEQKNLLKSWWRSYSQ